jgi:hypothetical protein
VGRLSEFFRNPFSFLFASRTADDRVAAYIVREHGRGRGLDDIRDDPYVVNRVTENDIGRILERPEVVKALGSDAPAAQPGGAEN